MSNTNKIMTVDKFGHHFNQKYSSEGRSKHLLKIFGFTLDGNNIDLNNKRIVNVAPPLDGSDGVNKEYVNSQIKHKQQHLKRNIRDEFNDLNRNFLNKIEERLNKIEEHISNCIGREEYDSQLNIIKSNVNILQKSLTSDISKDVIAIEKAVKDHIYTVNKDFINSIEERFNNIDDYIFKSIDKNSKVDVVKKRKLEPPTIKLA